MTRAAKAISRQGRFPLVIEVSDSSLAYDLGAKRRLYASYGLPEYWVVDVKAMIVHRFWSPADGKYRDGDRLPLNGPLVSIVVEGLQIDGHDLP